MGISLQCLSIYNIYREEQRIYSNITKEEYVCYSKRKRPEVVFLNILYIFIHLITRVKKYCEIVDLHEEKVQTFI